VCANITDDFGVGGSQPATEATRRFLEAEAGDAIVAAAAAAVAQVDDAGSGAAAAVLIGASLMMLAAVDSNMLAGRQAHGRGRLRAVSARCRHQHSFAGCSSRTTARRPISPHHRITVACQSATANAQAQAPPSDVGRSSLLSRLAALLPVSSSPSSRWQIPDVQSDRNHTSAAVRELF